MRNLSRFSFVGLSFSALVASAGAAFGGSVNYAVTIVTSQSTVSGSTSASAPVTGTFKGTYDATSNPTGTKTIPGLFGGSGNNPISYSATFHADGDVQAHPTGGFSLALDTGARTFAVSNLSIDLLGARSAAIGASVSINYDTFHTENPSAIFPGGFTIDIPVGDGSIDDLVAVQTGGAVSGALVPNRRGNFNFAAAVPVEITATITVNGQVIATDPIPFILPLAGTATFGETLTLTISGSTSFDQDTPIDPPQTFTDQPLDLPTVLPPGGTAHLLFSGSIASFSVSQDLDFNLVADGAAQLVPGDLDGDGTVGPADLAILLGAWGASGPGDLDGNGVVGPADLALLLGAWTN